MACSDFQTECLRVVTIGYLKSFIGNDVQDSSNSSPIYISSAYPDTYCPTYSELTGGSIIQTWSGGTTPRSDRDGITINQTWAGGSSGYAANQLVDQRDLGLKYTRLNTLSIERTSNEDISECSGTTRLRYTYNYNRYTKLMGVNCSVSTDYTPVDGPCSELTYHTAFEGLPNSGSSVSNCTLYTVYKNGSFSADPRTDNVTATVVFRGIPYTSNSVGIKQKALTGSYSREVNRWEETLSVTSTATSQTTFDCVGGPYSARGTRKFNVVGQFAWVDSCGIVYSQTQNRNISTNQTEDLGTQSGSFGNYNCCEGGHNETRYITFSKGGKSSPTITYTQNCSDCSSSCLPSCDGVDYTIHPDKQINCNGGSVTFTFEGGCRCSLLSIGTTSMSFAKSGETKTANFTLAAACGLDWSKPSWISITESRNDDGTGTLSCAASANDGDGRTDTIILKVNGVGCHTINVSQAGETPPPPPTPVDCPARGDDGTFNGVMNVFEHTLEAASGDDGGIIAFNTGNTAFSSVKSVAGDGTVVTSASMMSPDGTLPPGWTRVAVSHSTNSTTSTRSGSVTVTMTKTDGDDCSYVANFTQKAVSTCSVSFSVNNNTSTEVNGSVEIFWGLDQSRSFFVNVGRLAPGMTSIITVSLGSSTTAGACGQTINTAQFESPSYNTQMNINGSRMLNDGSTIYLTFPNS